MTTDTQWFGATIKRPTATQDERHQRNTLSNPPRLDRARGDRTAVHALFDGSDGAAAQQLSGAAASALLDTSREAFLQGLHFSAIVGAVSMLGAAVLAVAALRSRIAKRSD